MAEGITRKSVLSIGIAILFVLFVAYAIDTFYKGPEYENYCSREYVFVNDSATCVDLGGKWSGEIVPKAVEGYNGYCDLYYNCNLEYQEKLERYNRDIFFFSLILGIATFVGASFLMVESVSAGFIGGGILLVIYGTLRYWGSLSDLWRTLMIGLALGFLVYLGYRKLK